jgi:hypothetical protein
VVVWIGGYPVPLWMQGGEREKNEKVGKIHFENGETREGDKVDMFKSTVTIKFVKRSSRGWKWI